jgi:hypothetical protein
MRCPEFRRQFLMTRCAFYVTLIVSHDFNHSVGIGYHWHLLMCAKRKTVRASHRKHARSWRCVIALRAACFCLLSVLMRMARLPVHPHRRRLVRDRLIGHHSSKLTAASLHQLNTPRLFLALRPRHLDTITPLHLLSMLFVDTPSPFHV